MERARNNFDKLRTNGIWVSRCSTYFMHVPKRRPKPSICHALEIIGCAEEGSASPCYSIDEPPSSAHPITFPLFLGSKCWDSYLIPAYIIQAGMSRQQNPSNRSMETITIVLYTTPALIGHFTTTNSQSVTLDRHLSPQDCKLVALES